MAKKLVTHSQSSKAGGDRRGAHRYLVDLASGNPKLQSTLSALRAAEWEVQREVLASGLADEQVRTAVVGVPFPKDFSVLGAHATTEWYHRSVGSLVNELAWSLSLLRFYAVDVQR